MMSEAPNTEGAESKDPAFARAVLAVQRVLPELLRCAQDFGRRLRRCLIASISTRAFALTEDDNKEKLFGTGLGPVRLSLRTT